MERKNLSFALIVTILAAVSMTACNGRETEKKNVDTPVADTEAMVNIDTMDISSLFENDVTDSSATVATRDQESAPQTRKAEKKAAPSRGRETLYISTYGANGKVWGHVTMNGNTGRGTIHDDDENSYSITVTRHGNELHGTDQNGRLYVFNL